MGHIDTSNLHPVFQQAIAPFIAAPSKAHDREVFAAHGLQPLIPLVIKPTVIDRRKPRKSTQTFHYCLNGVDLECELDYQGPTGDGWNEPHEPADAQLCEAFCGDTDIVEILSDEQREEIETAFLEQEPEYDGD